MKVEENWWTEQKRARFARWPAAGLQDHRVAVHRFDSPGLLFGNRHNLNDSAEAGGLAARLGIRITLRDGGLKVLNCHTRRKRHRVFPKLADVEFMSGGDVEYDSPLCFSTLR